MSTTNAEANPMKPRAVRRVVTGHDSAGRAVVVADGPSEDVLLIDTARVAIADMWTLTSVPTSIDAWEKRDLGTPMAIGPVVGGLNFRVLQFDPLPADAVIDAKAAFSEMGSADAHVGDARHPAMHRTDTVDFGIVISGSITLLLDEEDVTLTAGDIVIQRGTNHAWENRGDEPCLMAVMVVDAKAAA
ncbi:cupin domain-containing protein [Amycolatopsis pithecellobii]|uniref:Cupin domain-containing protein n=1 Tax=Amycolatopsis pithecellobii TaxID=664692 RepID=A0A6N7Z1T0_9PSEU|nr:cupin domain-containing protein [Amycolatopsis pithecellobii]MTD53680.1 cupin domain-containing protein [Amycolatopsis pithecellobii]